MASREAVPRERVSHELVSRPMASPAGTREVVLYNPRAVFHTMPLGLLAIGSALDRSRYRIRIVDGRLAGDPVAAVLAALSDRTVCFGTGVLTGAPIQDALQVSRAVKAARPDLPVVWGGWHASLFPTDTLDESAIDITVQGQGEITFAELLDRLAAGDSANGVAGLTYREPGGRVVANPPRGMTNVNDLPAHDYELIPVERYFAAKGERQLDFITSAGCHFRCAFCADPFVYGRKWAGLEPERIADALDGLWRRYHHTDVNFQDETFFTFRKRIEALAEAILEREARYTWAATLRADQAERLSDEVFALCVKAGLRRVMIGVESGSQAMLDWMQKDITLEQVEEAAALCVRHGVGAIFPFIVGFPGESDESVAATLALAGRLRRMSPSFETPVFYFKPYPGSAITERVVAEGHRLPQSLEAWAEFDFIGSSGPWVDPVKHRLVERFKFYNRLSGGPRRSWRWPVRAVARWRCRSNRFGLPLEKLVLERLRPAQRLS